MAQFLNTSTFKNFNIFHKYLGDKTDIEEFLDYCKNEISQSEFKSK